MGEQLTERQVAVMRRSRTSEGAACTNWLTPPGMTTAQTSAVCRQLEARGLMTRESHYRHAWRITSSGNQWLRSLDAGRPWMVRGRMASRAALSPKNTESE